MSTGRNKKKKRTVIIILMCIVVVLTTATVWQWNNLSALMTFLKYSESDLEAQVSVNDTAISEAMQKLPGSISDLCEEDKEKLIRGDISEQEAIDIILNNSLSTADNSVNNEPSETAIAPYNNIQNAGDSTQPGVSSTADPNDDMQQNKKRQINELIAKLYVLRTTYTARVNSIMQQALDDYHSLPENQRSPSLKQNIFLKYIGQATAAETSCDAEIREIVGLLTPLLKETGGDLKLLDDITNAYNQEKATKKAYYMSMLKNG